MEQETKDNDILLQQMSKFNFEAPIKVILIFEDDDFNISLNKRSNCSGPASKKNVIKNPEQQIQSTNNFCFSNVSFDTMENALFNVQHETHFQPGQHSPNNINPENSCVNANQIINNHEPPQYNKTFINENRFQYDTKSNNSKKESSTDKLSPIEQKEILSLLDKVSYNLIEIANYYFKIFSYNSIGTYDNDMVRYLNFKHNYFNLSYYTVKSIIIPQETNKCFIQMYVKRTITLANNKNCLNIPKKYLLSLINDMIKWTKEKKNLDSTTDNRNGIQSSAANILNEKLIKNSNNMIANNRATKKNSNNICLFSCGPENQQVTISIQPEILKNNLNYKNDRKHRLDQNLQTCATKKRKSKTTDNSCHAQIKEQFHFHENSNRTQATFEHLPNKTYTPQAEHYNNLSYINPNINYLESDDINDRNQFVMSRSSISRDSGFVSPVPTTYTADPMAYMQYNISNHSVAPSSCYADAMNPCGYTVSSPCKVCCLETYKMCNGCYQEHYCSLECQKRDWLNHKFLCRR